MIIDKHLYLNNILRCIYVKNNPSEITENDLFNLIYDEITLPRVNIYYYEPKQLNTVDIQIPMYITDWYQRDYTLNDNTIDFKLFIDIDGENTIEIDNLKGGDYTANLGKLSIGEHWFSLKVLDKTNNIMSGEIFHNILITDSFDIQNSEKYVITDSDLITYNITKDLDETATEEQMKNNRVGLSRLFLDLQQQGYKYCILPNAIYRVNKCLRKGTIENEDCPILIPTNFTVDMNRSTFKLHPYDDREYGNIGKVENLIVSIYNCYDSHLINGTIEGDYFERKDMIWSEEITDEETGTVTTKETTAIDGLNGEGNNTLFIHGNCRYCTVENVEIKQTTGYNVCTDALINIGNWTECSWIENTDIINGQEISKEGYISSNLVKIKQEYLDKCTIRNTVYLNVGGIKGLHWNQWFHFYDENQQFIKTIKTLQYRTIRIPKGSKYIRTTLITDLNGINTKAPVFHNMLVPVNCEFKNCTWIDNRTCSAPGRSVHLAYLGCKFIRSGVGITPCEIDIEEAGENIHDFFLKDCTIEEHLGTASIIIQGGQNMVIENCDNWKIYTRWKIFGVTIKDCTNSSLNNIFEFYSKCARRVYNSELNAVSIEGGEKTGFYGEDYTKLIIKNCDIKNISILPKKRYLFLNCNMYLQNAYKDSLFKYCNFYGVSNVNYINGNNEFYNCTFRNGSDTLSYIKFSFNADISNHYKKCTFEDNSNFVHHNTFTKGIWDDCIFNGILTIDNAYKGTLGYNTMGDIQFNNCTFNNDIIIYARRDGIYYQFNNCTFNGTIDYKSDYARNSVEFNNCTGI